MRPKEFNALIALLEDPDNEVNRVVTDKIMHEGTLIVPLLEKVWEQSTSSILQKKIEVIVNNIQFQAAKENLAKWVDEGEQNLLEGAVNVAKFQYPQIEAGAIEEQLEKIRKDVWLELNETHTALEKVKTLNHIFYGVHGFSGNTTNFFAPQNHYINQVVESKKGGPVALAICYSVVAQRLGMPIYGVSLPKNYLLAYKDRYSQQHKGNATSDSILFYINPFNKGTVLGRKEIESFLVQNKIEVKDEYFAPCKNSVTISQLIASLMIAYQKSGNMEKVDQLQFLLNIVANQTEQE